MNQSANHPDAAAPAAHHSYPPRTALGLALAGLVIRIAVAVWRSGHDPLFHQPINDAAIYDQWARALLAGHPFGSEGAPFFLPPLYPYFTSFLYRLSGGSVWIISLVQALFGIGTILGIHRLGLRLHGERVGRLAGIVTLLFAPVVWYEGWQLPTILNLFLLVVTLNLVIECLDPASLIERRAWLIRLALGLTLGLASVNRPQNLLLAVFILLWMWWLGRKVGGANFRALGFILAGMVVAIAPVTLHNLNTGGEPVPISVNGGVNFYVGNHQGADGRFSFPPGFPAYIGQMQEASRQMASTEAGRRLGWQEASAHWFGKGMDDLAADPGRSFMLGLHKARLVLSWREMENNFVVSWVRDKSGPARWMIPSLGLVWLLAVPALVEAARRRRPEDWALLIPMLTVILVCLAFWVSTRNRLPLLIPLAVLAGVSLSNIRYWKAPLNLVVVALVALAVFWPTNDREGAGFLSDVGMIHAQKGEIMAARANFSEALRQEPNHPMAMNGMALTYMDSGQPERAIAMLKEVIRKHPDFELARQNLQAILNYQKRNQQKR